MKSSHEAAAGGIFHRLADFVIRWPLIAIGMWIAVAAALTLAIPPLAVVAAHKQVEALPADAPVVVNGKKMSEAFHETQHGSLLLVVLTDEKGLSAADEDTYRTLVGKLHQDTADVMSTQDFLGTQALREVLQSKDDKTWALPVSLVGDPGTPEAGVSYQHVTDLVKQTVAKSTLTANLTGPAATAADLMGIAAKDMHLIEAGTTVMVLLILIMVYRNPITMLIPLVTIGISLATAQGTLAGLGELGLGLTGETVVFVTAVMFGAGTDYAVFLISRYHDYVRQGVPSDEAVRKALMSIGKVIAASAATVAVTFLAMIFSQLQIFATVGPAISVSVTLAFLAAVTFLPAVMVLAGRRGWIRPRSDLTHRFWRRSAIRIVRRPKVHLVASLIVLATLASCMTFVRYNYDDRKTLPSNVESAAGFAALERHLPVNTLLPQYLFIQSPRDLRTPEALADLEQMAQRVSQVPNVTMVRGITRPMGESLEQTKATWQAGVVGGKLDDASKQIMDHTDDLNLLTHGSDQLAGALADVRAQVAQSMGTVHGLLASLTAIEQQVGGQKLLREVDNATKLISSMRAFGGSLNDVVAAARGSDILVNVLDSNPTICSADPQCAGAREQLRRLANANRDGTMNNLSNLAQQLQSTQDTQTLQSAVQGLNGAVSSALNALSALGADDPGGVQTRLGTLESGANQLADGSRKIADGVKQLTDQVMVMGSGLGEASTFLLGMKRGAGRPSMSGFYIPPNALANNADFKTAAEFFMSPDGHATRYYVMSGLNPFSTAAMDQVTAITNAARSAQPNTALADAKVSMLGMTEGLQDTRDYYNQDTEFIVVATILIVFLILVVLLRAIVAPLYLIASVLISYASALGIGVIVFQFLLGQELHWSAPGLTFILLVAVGADYNLLLISRIRDESPHGVRFGVIRTVSSTGAVITSAGLIFAASMFGLTVASISTLVQIGFVIGAGILLDTFLVRTITVPAVATLLGQANWWPSKLTPRNPGGSRSKWRKTSRRPAPQSGASLSDLVVPDDEDIFTHSLPLFGPRGVPLRLAAQGQDIAAVSTNGHPTREATSGAKTALVDQLPNYGGDPVKTDSGYSAGTNGQLSTTIKGGDPVETDSRHPAQTDRAHP
ncbi:MAG: RND family transporter, partial [Mycobacterium sp.]|uniref:MMPL/RND family transporter n=1 Tax=Mycobacterium sp. TaxID=1785 RepID=UPI003CC58A9C